MALTGTAADRRPSASVLPCVMDGFGDVFRTTTMIAMITMDRLVLRYGDVSGVVKRDAWAAQTSS